jgi:hypothetical protein
MAAASINGGRIHQWRLHPLMAAASINGGRIH